MARKNQVVGFRHNTETGHMVFTVGGEELVFDPAMASAKNRAYAEVHGWRQRIADKAALGKDATDGQKADAIRSIIAHYESGTDAWDMTRAGGARKTEFAWTVEALAEVQGTDVETIVAKLEAMAEKNGTTKEAIAKKLSTQKDVATMIAELKAGGGAADAEEMLAELMSD